MDNLSREYKYSSPDPTWANSYLWGPIQKILLSNDCHDRRVFEIGCGSGATSNMLKQMGFAVTALDPSTTGISIASSSYTGIHFIEGSAYDDLAATHGTFPFVLSLEVIEHCFWPRRYAKTIFNLLQPGGMAIISTPYHGYIKNLALALAGEYDKHWSPLWEGGHIKFWSRRTLHQLLIETGFLSVDFVRVGRVPMIAKSMIAVARKDKGANQAL